MHEIGRDGVRHAGRGEALGDGLLLRVAARFGHGLDSRCGERVADGKRPQKQQAARDA